MNARVLRGCWLALGLAGLVPVHAQLQPPVPHETRVPAYPEELQDTGRSGNARITMTVTAEGRVADPQVEWASHPVFGREALAAVRTWRFEPGTREGQPVALRVTVPVEFKAPVDQQFNAFLARRVFRPLPAGIEVVDESDLRRGLRLAKRLPPVLPMALWGNTYTEVVKVNCIVGPDGLVLNPTLETMPENPELATPALMTAALTRYRPPVKGKQPVFVRTVIPVDFGLKPQQATGPFWEQFDDERVPSPTDASGYIRPQILDYSDMGYDFRPR